MENHLSENLLKQVKQVSLLPIIIGNIIPLIGVAFFDWDLAQVIILYWIENLIIGFWNIPRILTAGNSPKTQNFGMSVFFIIHYGIFCMVHGAFIVSMLHFSDNTPQPAFTIASLSPFITKGVIIGAATMFISIGSDFIQNHILNGKYKNTIAIKAMSYPYGHIIVIHIAIILTAIITFLLGTPIALLLLLIIGKTVLEYYTRAGKFGNLSINKK